MTLLHLVSEQTMQNVLPALALRPARLIQVRSRAERFEKSARATEAALREAGLEAEFFDWPLDSDFPDLDQTRRAIKYWLPMFPDAVVNITGGTKLMSAGALLGAREFSSARVLYCDTERRQFLSPFPDMPLPAMPSFDDVARTLTVRVVMAAHGRPPAQWKFDTADAGLLEFGRTAFHLRRTASDAFQACEYSKHVRGFYRSDMGRIPKSAAKLTALLTADLRDAFREELLPPVRGFLEAAVRAGLLAKEADGSLHLVPPAPGRSVQPYVARLANLLDGSWLELAVLDLVQQSRSFADPHWSVEPVSSAQESTTTFFGETDVVCLRSPQGVLQLISCKTTLEKPLEHLESIRERASNLGGRFARATLALLTSSKDQTRDLRRWGSLLDVEILVGEEITRLVE